MKLIKTSHNPLITFSVVSHGQGALIQPLLKDFARLSNQDFEVIVTINIPEDESCYLGHPFPVRIVRNDIIKGFGENHNAAFAKSNSNFFAVVNPDIRIKSIDLQELLFPFDDQNVAAVAPVVLSNIGGIEDSARRFPTLMRLAKRLLLQKRSPEYVFEKTPQSVDWVAGMFVVFRSVSYLKINGFDDHRFFMYMEDVDICRRLHNGGWEVVVNPNVNVIHNAQRASRRNLKHLRWHLVSAVRYLTGF